MQISLRWLPPVERVGGADMMSLTTVRLFSQCLNVPSLFGLDGNVKQLIIAESADLHFRYLDKIRCVTHNENA